MTEEEIVEKIRKGGGKVYHPPKLTEEEKESSYLILERLVSEDISSGKWIKDFDKYL